MKRLTLLLIGFCVGLSSFAQTPQGFNYQAVIRDTEGQPLADQAVSIRLTLQNEDGTTEYYIETHSTTTSPQGVMSLAVGSGIIVSGSLAEIPWESGGVYLKLEVDPSGGSTYSLLGTSQLLAVPYALYAASGNPGPEGPTGPPGPEGPLVEGTDGQTLRNDGTTWVASSNIYNTDANVGIGTVTPSEKLEVAGNIKAQGRLIGQSVEVNQPIPEETPIFVVRNSLGQIVFAVYESGVRVYVEDTPSTDPVKQSRGGFAVGGLSDQTKEGGVEYLRITPDSVRFNINTGSTGVKATRGGFAVGGLSDQTKGLSTDMLFIAPDSARIYVNSSSAKQSRGGFAVGGLSDQTKGIASNFLYLTPENYFIGHEAGSSITTGLYNSFIGYEAGKLNTEGKSGIFIGYRAGLQNTTGAYNTFIGNYAGANNTIGYNNVFIGDSAGIKNINGYRNIFFGNLSGKENISGEDNVAIGTQAGQSNTTGARNVFLGTHAGFRNTTGRLNIFMGVLSGALNTTGERNIFIGQASGYANQTSSYNVFIGDRSGWNSTTGESNVFMGWWSGAGNRTGNGNVYIGQETAFLNQNGNSNVYVGYQAGKNSYGEKNVFIGPMAGYYETSSNRLHIANNESNSLIYGEFDNQKVEINGSVKINSLLNLNPQSTTPGNPEVGDVFYDANSNSIKFFNGSQWMELSATVAASPPFVETHDVLEEYLTYEACQVNYFISSQGSSAIIESGIYYTTIPFFDTETASKVLNSSTEIGELFVNLTELTELTTYYVRSFATNTQGVALGNMISFTTPANPAPTVSTNPVINIKQTTASAGGNVIKEGDTEVTERGICWSTNPEPTIASNVIDGGFGQGDFVCEITGLSSETNYYVRAYATNSLTTSYGDEVVFTTAPEEMTVTDADENIYNIVQIGTQTWMKENLKSTKYRDGSLIPNITGDVDWESQTEGAYCWYDNDEVSYKDSYGALYNFYAVSDSRNLCPVGWHVATWEEWITLVDYLGGEEIAGLKLKEEGTAHWSSPNTGADNSSGFTGLPGGFRYDQFGYISIYGFWWSSSAVEVYLGYNNARVYFASGYEIEGLSVRCIKD